jgi:hypothetical protein
MRNGILARTTTAALAAAAALVLATAPMASAYPAGSSTAVAPTYDGVNLRYLVKCNFTGWSGVKVNATCTLKDGYTGQSFGSRSVSFSDGSESVSFYVSRNAAQQYVCTNAFAGYADGSSSKSGRACR